MMVAFNGEVTVADSEKTNEIFLSYGDFKDVSYRLNSNATLGFTQRKSTTNNDMLVLVSDKEPLKPGQIVVHNGVAGAIPKKAPPKSLQKQSVTALNNAVSRFIEVGTSLQTFNPYTILKTATKAWFAVVRDALNVTTSVNTTFDIMKTCFLIVLKKLKHYRLKCSPSYLVNKEKLTSFQ